MSKMMTMRRHLAAIVLLVLACGVWANGEVAVLPGAQYVLRNAATGSYITKDGGTTDNELEAANWRVMTNDTIFVASPNMACYIHSDETILQLVYSSFSWKVNFSPQANTTDMRASQTTPGAFNFHYRYLASNRYLGVEVDGEAGERLAPVRDASPYSDWLFVPSSHPKDYSYRIWSMNRSSGNSRYCIAYRSHDPKGEPIWLSGWMAVPTSGQGGASVADHFLFSAHYTMCKESQWPTASDPLDAYSFKFLSNKPIMVEPDFLGCGITADRDHPYIAADIMAEESVDMLFAAYDLMRDLHQTDCRQARMPTYGIGSSQGASIILACQKYVETSPRITDEQRDIINWVRTNACAGAYNPLATLSQYLYQDELQVSNVVPLLIIGMVAGFPDIFGETKAEEYFSDALLEAGIMEMIRSHKYDSEEIANAINKSCGSNMHSILSTEAQDLNSDLSQKLLKAFGQCDLTRDWSPKADVILYYYPDDEVVPHLNLVSVTKGLQDKCQGKFETRQTTLGIRHVVACANFFATIIFGGYKE